MRIVLLISLFLFTSCSTKKSYNYSSVYEGVSLSNVDEKEIPLIEPSGQRQSYGPVIKEDTSYTNSNFKKVKALFLYPAAMPSITYLQFVDNLQKYKLEPTIYSGAGLGAVIAAFLAKGLTTDHIEWKLFSLLEELKGIDYYSSSWRDLVYQFLKKEFKNDKVENLKKALILPIYDKKLNKVRYVSRGDLYTILIINLEIDNRSSKLFQSPLINGDLDINELKNNGVDRVAVINSLGSELNFHKTNHYLIGLYGKLIGYERIESKKSDETIRWFNLVRNNVELDRIVDLQKLQQTTLNKNESTLEKIRDFFKKE